MKVPSNLAFECADSIMNYCLTRFPCDTPPHPMLDRPWFAEKVQLAIEACTTEIMRLKAGLGLISQLLSDRVPCMIAQATLDGAELLDNETAIAVCEGKWRKPT